MSAGDGTNIQNAILEAQVALDGGHLEDLDPALVEAASVVVGKLLADYELLASNPPGARDQSLILNLMAALRSGNNAALGVALRLVDLPEVVAGAAPTPAAAENAYLVQQNVMLTHLHVEANAAIKAQGAQRVVAEADAGVAREKKIALAKVAVKTGLGLALGQAPIPGLAQVYSLALAINQVRSTLQHLTNLRTIRADMVSRGVPASSPTMEDLDYLVGKKKQKAIGSALGGVPGVGTAKTIALKGKGLYKFIMQTRGEHRREAAGRLRAAARNNDIDAQRIILEIVGQDHYRQALFATTGVDLIIAKMASQ